MPVFKNMKDLPPLPHEVPYFVAGAVDRRSLPPVPFQEEPREVVAPPVPSKSASFTTLPNEILETIFVLAIGTSFPVEDPNYPHPPPPYTKHSSSSVYGGRSPCHASHLLASVLAQTCHRFRDMVLHTPSLWAFINVTRVATPRSPRSSTSSRTQSDTSSSPVVAPPAAPRSRGTLDADLGWLPLYLVRAGPAPLRIVLDTTKYPLHTMSTVPQHTYPPSAPSTSRPASRSPLEGHPLGYLLGTSSRWGSLTILTSHLGSSSLAPVLSALSHLEVPNLTSLRVKADIWREGIVSFETLPPFFLNGAPKLRSIRLDGANLNWGEAPFVYPSAQSLPPGPPMHNLRTLHLNFATRYPSFEGFRALLEEGCPNLERLVINDDFAGILRHIEPPRMPYFDELEGIHGRPHGRSGRHRSQSGASGLVPGPHHHHHHGGGANLRSSQISSSSSGSSTDYYPSQYQAYHQPAPTLPPPSPVVARSLQQQQQNQLPSPPVTATFPPSSPTQSSSAPLLNSRYSLSSSSDGGSSSGSSSPTSPTSPYEVAAASGGAGGSGGDTEEREGSGRRSVSTRADFRKIKLKKLRYLEIRPYRSNAVLVGGSGAGLGGVPGGHEGSGLPSPGTSPSYAGGGGGGGGISPGDYGVPFGVGLGAGGSGPAGSRTRDSLVSLKGTASRQSATGTSSSNLASSSSTHALLVASASLPARLLYLFDTPRLETLVVAGVKKEEWRVVAEMMGLPVDLVDFVPAERTVEGSSEEGFCEEGSDDEEGRGRRTFPFMRTLDVRLG